MLVDARGLRCPAPVLRLARAAVEAPVGTVIEVWATDPAAEPDIRAWARMRGHEVIEARSAADDVPRDADDDGDPQVTVVVRVRVARPT